MIRGSSSAGAACAADPSGGPADAAGDGAGCGAGEGAGVAAGVGDPFGPVAEREAPSLTVPPPHAIPAAAITNRSAAAPIHIPVSRQCRRMRDLLRRNRVRPGLTEILQARPGVEHDDTVRRGDP